LRYELECVVLQKVYENAVVNRLYAAYVQHYGS